MKKPSPGNSCLAAAAEALLRTAEAADAGGIRSAASLLARRIRAGGRLHLAGVGKAGFVSARAAATLSSWGVPAQVLHYADAPHGDLGQTGPRDAAILVSKSGASREIVDLAKALRARRLPLIAVTGAPHSALARSCDRVLAHPSVTEGGPWGLAPMASLLAEAALLDALITELVTVLGGRPRDFAAHHPGGTLGRRAARLARQR